MITKTTWSHWHTLPLSQRSISKCTSATPSSIWINSPGRIIGKSFRPNACEELIVDGEDVDVNDDNNHDASDG